MTTNEKPPVAHATGPTDLDRRVGAAVAATVILLAGIIVFVPILLPPKGQAHSGILIKSSCNNNIGFADSLSAFNESGVITSYANDGYRQCFDMSLHIGAQFNFTVSGGYIRTWEVVS